MNGVTGGGGASPAPRYRFLVFDLDETLYCRNAGLMQEIGCRIVLYLTERLGFAPDEAARLRQHFFTQYGTTLRGLQVEHHVDVDDYLYFVHDIPIERYLMPDPALEAMLGRLPLTKVIFTSADSGHARRVLARLGIAHHFGQVFDIRATGFYNKPDTRAYEMVLTGIQARGAECIMIEDSARNLVPAKTLGMTTVLVDGQGRAGVDYVIGTLFELECLVGTLLNGSPDR